MVDSVVTSWHKTSSWYLVYIFVLYFLLVFLLKLNKAIRSSFSFLILDFHFLLFLLTFGVRPCWPLLTAFIDELKLWVGVLKLWFLFLVIVAGLNTHGALAQCFFGITRTLTLMLWNSAWLNLVLVVHLQIFA